jgi:hypothetical protein
MWPDGQLAAARTPRPPSVQMCARTVAKAKMLSSLPGEAYLCVRHVLL